MPHYFFHLHECADALIDPEGKELPDAVAAHRHAVQEARHIMSAEVLEGRLCLACHFEIHDADQALVKLVPFREALAVTGI